MDSINKQQAESNRLDLRGTAALDRIQKTVDKSATCFFCTRNARGDSLGTRPMGVQHVDSSGALLFLSASDSHKNAEIAQDPEVALMFQGSEHAGFLLITGRATLSTDRRTINKLWQPVMKTWFTEGKEDPRITVIKVEPRGGYYWDNKHGAAVAGAKMLIGAALGKTLDDSIEGRLLPG